MLSPDSQFGELASAPPVADGQSEQPPAFKVILFPELCSPPVGLFWPTSTTRDEFCRSLQGNNLFSAFVDCCQNPMVAEWFARVNSDPSEFLVHMVDALPLWRALPTPSQPNGIGINERDEVVTFQYQFDRFLWALHCDRIQRFPATWSTLDDKKAFYWYLKHGDQLYPEGLGDSKVPPTHRAFF
eukprot:scaffold17721_cov184-Cylindrotheca_fusiformis.AAC.1